MGLTAKEGIYNYDERLELRDLVLNLSPNAIISGRIGGYLRAPSTLCKGLGDYISMGDNQIPDRRIEDCSLV